MTTVTAAITGRTDFMLKRRPPHPSHDENRREAKISFAEIDSGAGVFRLQNEEERVAGRGLYPRGRNLLLPGLRGRHWLHLLFFFKQKTAYELGLGIPAEPLFRSPRFAWSTPQRQKLKFLPLRRYNLTLNLLSRSHD